MLKLYRTIVMIIVIIITGIGLVLSVRGKREMVDGVYRVGVVERS